MNNLHCRMMEKKSNKDGGCAWIILAGETDKKIYTKLISTTYHRGCNKSKTSGAESSYSPPEFTTMC